ncbi:MAG: sodium:proton antiporter [Maricaulis sp.]|jgi:NhaP-type Na+/H+ or K+/H+ antiporter|nr:sodium:proton antiporter [Maricaulis sp.]MDG2043106.1 sodium:proton antiporter [Maricaulis sp.]
MIEAPSDLTLTIALIAGSGAAAQWLAWRLRWPSIVLMMGAGLLLGPIAALMLGDPILDPGGAFGSYLRPMIALAVAVILFEGGITLNFRELRDASTPVLRMVFLGFPLGWALATVCLHYLAGLAWDLSAMIGALLTTTGPTVVLPLLRQAKLPSRVASVLKWEGIVNDPIGAIAAVFIYEAIHQTSLGHELGAAMGFLVFGAVIGGILGFAFGTALSQSFRRGWVPEPMKAPMVLAAVLVCFAIADSLASETGLVAVTIFGLVVANSRLASIEEMRRFKEGIASILVASVFVVLAAQVTSSDVLALNLGHLAFIIVFILIARPLSVVLATLGSGLSKSETAFIGFIGPRGVVAAAAAGHLSVSLVAAGREDAAILAPLVFATIFVSVFGCGFLVAPLARGLKLSETGPERLLVVGANPWSLGLAEALAKADIPVTIADTSWRRLKAARLAGHDVYYGEVLSESADWRLEPSRFASLLAVTPNDAYNALVCIEYAPEFGRSRVFQLSGFDGPVDNGESEEDPRAIVYTARGRTAIRRGRGFDSLARDWWAGWRFRTTTLSEEYTLEQCLSDDGETSDVILSRAANGKIAICGPGKQPSATPGTVLIRFAPSEENGA